MVFNLIFSSRSAFFRRGMAGFLLALAVAAPAGAEPFRFPWDQPPPQTARRAPEKSGLSANEVRAILANQGARLIGSPRQRGGETIAIGRDAEGRKQFTLDAAGAVVQVEIIVRTEKDPRKPEGGRRDNADDLAAPGLPLPPPQHATDGVPAPEATAPPAAAPASSAAPKPADSADAALSPIRPIHPPGAPKVEPLPQ